MNNLDLEYLELIRFLSTKSKIELHMLRFVYNSYKVCKFNRLEPKILNIHTEILSSLDFESVLCKTEEEKLECEIIFENYHNEQNTRVAV